jgi:hypothetical protein
MLLPSDFAARISTGNGHKRVQVRTPGLAGKYRSASRFAGQKAVTDCAAQRDKTQQELNTMIESWSLDAAI